MSYFYTLEVFGDMVPRFVDEIDTSDIFKLTLVSNDYEFDVQAQGELEYILANMLIDEELNELEISYNPDFFPESVVLGEFPEDVEAEMNKIEIIEEFDEDLDELNLNFDGTVMSTSTEFDMEDIIQNSYLLVDEMAETLLLRANVIVDPTHYPTINFDTITTVH